MQHLKPPGANVSTRPLRKPREGSSRIFGSPRSPRAPPEPPRDMRRVALMAAYSDPIELAAAYNELVERHDYLEDELQKRIADVRVLKKKYSTLQEESVALLWGRLAGAPGDLAALPPLDAGVAEAEDRTKAAANDRIAREDAERERQKQLQDALDLGQRGARGQ